MEFLPTLCERVIARRWDAAADLIPEPRGAPHEVLVVCLQLYLQLYVWLTLAVDGSETFKNGTL